MLLLLQAEHRCRTTQGLASCDALQLQHVLYVLLRQDRVPTPGTKRQGLDGVVVDVVLLGAVGSKLFSFLGAQGPQLVVGSFWHFFSALPLLSLPDPPGGRIPGEHHRSGVPTGLRWLGLMPVVCDQTVFTFWW